MQVKMAHGKIVGISRILSLAAGVHRVRGRARVRVASFAEVHIVGPSGVRKMRAVLVYRWGYNPKLGTSQSSLQSVLTTSGLDEGGYDPDTLQVANGLLFLGGHLYGHDSDTNDTTEMAAVFVAKPAVRDGWTSVTVENTAAANVTVLAVSPTTNTDNDTVNHNHPYLLAVGLSDGTVIILSYDLAARTNRLSSIHKQSAALLRPLCILRGELDIVGLDNCDCLWPRERFFSMAYRGGGSPSLTWTPPTSPSYSSARDGNEDGAECTSLSWIPNSSSSGISSLPLLAAAFSSGIAVYHVIVVPPSTNAPIGILSPYAAAKFLVTQEQSEIMEKNVTIPKPRARIGWYDLGPRHPTCLTLLFEHEKRVYQRDSMELLDTSFVCRLCLAAIDIPWYGGVEANVNSDDDDGRRDRHHRPIGVICQKELNIDGESHNDGTMSIVSSHSSGAITCYSSALGNLQVCQPACFTASTTSIGVAGRMDDGHFSSLSRPVASSPLGLDSNGSVYFGAMKPSKANNDHQDVMLTVFSVTTCRSRKEDESNNNQNWSIMPLQRHWLLISNPGDNSTTTMDDPVAKGDHVVKGGATTDILFELTCGENPMSGLVPQRIAKEMGGRRVAVMFSSGFFGGNFVYDGGSNNESRVRTHTRLSPDAVAYTILDINNGINNGGEGSASFKLRHGRDVAFLPPSQTADFYCSSLVVLDHDGLALSITTAITSHTLPQGENERVVESIQKCSLQYEGIVGRRVFALLNGGRGPPEILLAGYSTVVGRPCLLLSKHYLEKVDGISEQLTLVEDVGLGHRLWLRPGEEIVSVVELPVQDDEEGAAVTKRSNVAVASQERVMILSMEDSLTIIAEMDVRLTCSSLSPLGSHCVTFCASSCGGSARVMYLSCLEKDAVRRHGIIASIPASKHGTAHNTLLAAVRPDRCIYFGSHSGLQMGEDDEEDEHAFVTPLPCTRPLLLLEPLIANALCQDGARGKNAATNSAVQLSLRTIIEKFGRKDSSFPHGDDQGIGTFGAGVTSHVYDMLARHKCNDAASILLTGNLPSDLISQPKILPPWIPLQTKLSAVTANTGGAELMMQVLSCGDSELAEYLCHSDRSVVPSPTFPGQLDLSCILAEELAFDALREGSSSAFDAIKLLDLAGRQSSESLLSQLALSLGTSPSTNKTLSDFEKLLKEVGANVSTGNKNVDTINKYAELCSGASLRLMHQRKMSGGASSEKCASSIPVSQLAPSVQSVWESERVRNTIISNDVIESVASSHSNNDAAWKQSINKNKHVWSAGPFGKKESLLELDGFEDWLGRCRPAVLGKEGVAIAADTGERTLADILAAAAMDEEAAGASSDTSEENKSLDSSRRKNWVEGVGEGRLDEDNLSLYIRFSEGADEDGNWRADGFTDLAKHAHLARLYGSELASIEATTSSVDEGEEGKVRLLYDLVYHDGAPRDQPTGVVVEAPRGGSLDVGMLHGTQHTSRQRCTIELWYHLPQAGAITDEVILARRSLFYEENNDASMLCMPDEKHNVLWELAVLPSGLLELRTGAGSVVTSAMFIEEGDDNADGFVSWEREDGGGGWNHVCLVFSSLSHSSSTEFSASILMNGAVVVPSATLSVNPFGSAPDQDLNQEDIEDAMESSVLIFGIGPSIGFRITDLRVWACQRSEDDIKMMMYEYLRDAEMKKKLKVNIRKGAKKSTGGLLPPPIRLPQPESKKGFALAPPPRPSPAKRTMAADDVIEVTDAQNTEFMPSFANFSDTMVEEAPTQNNGVNFERLESLEGLDQDEVTPNFADFVDNVTEDDQALNEVDDSENIDPPETPGFANFNNNMVKEAQALNDDDEDEGAKAEVATIPSTDTLDKVEETPASAGDREPPTNTMEELEEETPAKSSFDVTFSDLLSTKVRKSAAAAIIRGPPAAQHFGGNRGGLASEHVNFGDKCDGVGPIAICGVDKSVVWFSDRDPPGRTYPIGASGAVISDLMDEDETEYMCCFLAKEKRMIVFELSRKTVIVELQMKTKLNFWRYLPPEAHGSLAFMLITPIGGFHWKPLDESPRPSQVWKRGPELESKKILAYEEGGSNGHTGVNARSTVALVMASSATPRSNTVEAYCIAMNNGSSFLCVSNVVLGAALYRPTASAAAPLSYFLPYVITISKDVMSRFVLDIEDLMEEFGTLARGNIIASTVLDIGDTTLDESYEPPSMSMGPSPEALCCCHDGFIVVAVRRKGLVFAYDFSSGDLILVGQSGLGQYIVDAAIRSSDVDGEVELVLLLCESDDTKDGRVATVNISRVDGVSPEYLSSI